VQLEPEVLEMPGV